MVQAEWWTRELQVAKDLARQAGAAAMRHYAGHISVSYKDEAQSDPVTPADKEANRLIVDGLKAAFPHDAVLAEESKDNAARLTQARLWCVDPIDGTREFIARNGHFVVMIGLAIDGLARLGVVYQPTEDRLWWGVDNHAALETAEVLQVLKVSHQADASRATAVVSRSHLSRSVNQVLDTMGVRKRQPTGSVGLKAAYISEGAADIYVSTSSRTKEWDACAPEAIARAAGGKITDVMGEPLRYNKPDPNTPRGIVITNGVLHGRAIGALGPFCSDRGFV